MNILLCNDDGYQSRGITLLKEKLAKYGDVYIIAPEHHMSGKSCAINIGVGLNLIKHDNKVYSFSGTPADCVAFALSTYPIKFDLVISGCNNGLNISYDTMYSGTIGVCLEALRYRVPAIAFSCPAETGFPLVNKNFDDVMSFILNNKLIKNEYLLNVNFPEGKVVKGISLSKLYYRNDKGFFEKKDDGLYYVGRECEKDIQDQESDCYQVENGIVSITPLKGTYYCDSLYKKLLKKIK